jgi:hypothetical protein
VEAIAGRLVGPVLNAAAPRLKKLAVGTEEQRAIRKAFNAAFTVALDDVSAEAGVDVELIEPQLKDFFSDPQVCGALVEVALSGRPPDPEQVRAQLWAIGFDPSTFPLDLGDLVRRISLHLVEELRRHAAQHDSALFNEVVLADLANILEQLGEAGRGDARRTVGQAPPLPGLVLGREAAASEIKARLGISNGRANPAATQVITAVRGWPGVGKTTLVSAIAHDADVIAAFPDGVLWAALTHADRVADELASWARAVGLESRGAAATVPELSARLRAALRDKRMLLLLDDVWEVAHAEPFRVGGRGCALLITTRIPAVASALAPTPKDVYRLDVLDDDSALELLERLAPTVVAEHPDATRELVQELEALPLALQVAGHQLNSQASIGLGVEQLLEDLRAGAKLLEADAPADRVDLVTQTTPTVAALLSQSTDRLSAGDRDRFALLGAFAPKPATFSAEALASVWETPDPVPTIRTLVQGGLLEPLGSRRFQLHAVLVLHANALLED